MAKADDAYVKLEVQFCEKLGVIAQDRVELVEQVIELVPTNKCLRR